ncbi:MAG: ArsR/SmtB family transcription factor [Aeromonas sp.]
MSDTIFSPAADPALSLTPSAPELEALAKAFKELGHPTRLFIFKHLVKAGTHGLAVGALQHELAIPASTLSHHISALVSAGLVTQTRAQRQLICTSDYGRLAALIAFLQAECCINDPKDLTCALPAAKA